MQPDFIDRYARLDSPEHALAAAPKLLAALAALSRVPAHFLARRLLIAAPFALGVAALALWQPDGLRIFLILLAKSTLCLATMILLTTTTPFTDLLAALRRARLPAVFVTTLALLYRYLFVLREEAARMRRARWSRSFAATRAHRWRALATVAGHLFIRSTERAERIYAAMSARGWESE